MALSVVQGPVTAGTTSSVTSVAASFGAASTAGNLIVVIVASRNHTVNSVTDGSNTYTQVGGAYVGPSSNNTYSIWYAKNAASVSTITAAFSGADTYYNIAIYEIAGADRTTPLLTWGFNTDSGASMTCGIRVGNNVNNFTIPLNAIVIAGGSSSPTISAGSGYTFTSYGVTGDATKFFFAETHIVSSDEKASASNSGGSFWMMAAAVFRAAGAGSSVSSYASA